MKTSDYKNTLLSIAISMTVCSTAVASVIDEIVVTAQKREQNMQDVGVSVTAFTGDAMQELGMVESTNVAAQTPGLSYGGTGGLNTILNIRGVSQNDFALHQETPVTVYMDEGYISFPSAQLFTTLDLERVEVLRGPQGTLFGRNATGGLLHFVTKKPSFEAVESNVTLKVGEHGLAAVQGGIGGPISDTVAGRLAVNYSENDTYIDNATVDGLDAGDNDEWSARGTLLWQPTNDLAVTLGVTAYENERSINYGYLPSSVNAEGLTIATGPVTDSTETVVDQPGGWESDATHVNLNVQYDIGEVTLTSITTYLDHYGAHFEDSDVQTDPFALGDNGIRIWSAQDNEQITQEFRLNGEFDNGGTWVTGLFYMDREQFGLQRIDWGTLFDDPDLGVNPGLYNDTYRSDSDILAVTESWAVFAQVEVPVTDTLALTLGARHTQDELEFDFDTRDFITGIEIAELNSANESDEKDWSGKVQLDWDVAEGTLVYAGISRGTKGGGYNSPYIEGALLGEVNKFDGEVLTSYEVGVKSDFDNGWRLNASAFYYDYQDYQGFVFENLVSTLVNYDAESQGLELELVANPAEGLDVLVGLSYLDAEIENGNTMPFSPEFSVNALVRQSWNLSNGAAVAAQLDANWSDEQEMDPINSPGVTIDAKHTINARLSYTNPEDSMTIALMAHNLTDEENVSFFVPVGVLGYSQVLFEKPRWVSLEASFRF